MGKAKDIWEGFDTMTKRIIQLGAAITVLTGLVSGAWAGINYFATNKRVDKDVSQLVAMVEGLKEEYKFDKEKARKRELREILYDCETKYKENRNEFMEKTCKDAKIELDEMEDSK